MLKFLILLFNISFNLLLVSNQMFIFLSAFLNSLEILVVSLPDIHFFDFSVSIFCNTMDFSCFSLFFLINFCIVCLSKTFFCIDISLINAGKIIIPCAILEGI
jgi:hypothetical protein